MFKIRKIEVEWDLLVIDVLTLILILVITSIITGSTSIPLRIALGLPFVLFFPGYTLTAALFPRKKALSGVERIALSLGLSIAVTILSGLILNYAWNVSLYPLLLFMTFFIFAMSAIAWYRRKRLPMEERFSVPFLYRLPTPKWHGAGRWDKALSIILAVSILGAIGMMAFVISTPKVGERYSEFYVLGPGDMSSGDYPTEFVMDGGAVTGVWYTGIGEPQWVDEGTMGRVRLGIVNNEHKAVSYRVEVLIYENEGTSYQPEVWAKINGEWQSGIEMGELAHEGKWEHEIGFAPQYISDSDTLTETAEEKQTFLILASTHNFEANDYIQIGSTADTNVFESTQIDTVVSDTKITLKLDLMHKHVPDEPVFKKQKVEFRLFKNGEGEPYSTLHFWFPVVE